MLIGPEGGVGSKEFGEEERVGRGGWHSIGFRVSPRNRSRMFRFTIGDVLWPIVGGIPLRRAGMIAEY